MGEAQLLVRCTVLGYVGCRLEGVQGSELTARDAVPVLDHQPLGESVGTQVPPSASRLGLRPRRSRCSTLADDISGRGQHLPPFALAGICRSCPPAPTHELSPSLAGVPCVPAVQGAQTTAPCSSASFSLTTPFAPAGSPAQPCAWGPVLASPVAPGPPKGPCSSRCALARRVCRQCIPIGECG